MIKIIDFEESHKIGFKTIANRELWKKEWK